MRPPKIYSGLALPQRSLDDFYELRTPQSGERAAIPAVEHPMLGERGDSAATRRAMSSPHRRGGRRRRA